MTNGVTPEGFVRRTLSAVLRSLESRNRSALGVDVIQTAPTPLGQINGVVAAEIDEVWQLAQNVYSSASVAEAEGSRLDDLGSLRRVTRNGESDEDYRRRIMNLGQTRLDLADLRANLSSISGVESAEVFLDSDGSLFANEPQTISVVVVGGLDSDVAQVMSEGIAPGINTRGNTTASVVSSGLEFSYNFTRPVEISFPVVVGYSVSTAPSTLVPPTASALADFLVSAWNTGWRNGVSITEFEVRKLVEAEYSQIKVVSVDVTEDDGVVDFFSIARLSSAVFEAV